MIDESKYTSDADAYFSIAAYIGGTLGFICGFIYGFIQHGLGFAFLLGAMWAFAGAIIGALAIVMLAIIALYGAFWLFDFLSW